MTGSITPNDCKTILLAEVEQAVHADEYSELVWQALICAYLGHDGWREVADALFVKHGYTIEEISRKNEGYRSGRILGCRWCRSPNGSSATGRKGDV